MKRMFDEAAQKCVLPPTPSYYRDWIDTLERLMKLDATTIVLSEVSNSGGDKKVETPADWKIKLAGQSKTAQGAFDAFFVAPAVDD